MLTIVQDFLDDIIKEQLVFRELPIRRVDIRNLTFGGRPLQIESVCVCAHNIYLLEMHLLAQTLKEQE
jgi:hypothetical protein